VNDVLLKYIPEHAVKPVFELIVMHHVHLKIVNERVTRHGDYRSLAGKHEITVNANLNKYRFLMTLVHEISHLVAFEKYGRNIKPHGNEWKYVFQQLMVPFIRPEIFPNQLLPLLARHFRNPSASSDTDATLSIALKKF
jgi:predicted SprT family Zn-dependent metalloprotease